MINLNTQDQIMAPPEGVTDQARRPVGQLPHQENRQGLMRRDTDCDPLAKRESAALEARDSKRREIWSKKKVANLTKAAAQGVEVMLLNVRGINTQAKQIMLAKEMAKRTPRIMILTETKLTKIMGLNGFATNQTQQNRGGGCWVGAATAQMKPIKTFSNSINWVKSEMYGNHIHVIAVYMTPGKKERQEHDILQLEHILGQLSNSPFGAQQILMAGDFNETMDDITKISAKYGLQPTIPTGTKTHLKGGHLDQVFTNMEYDNVEVTAVDKRLSDHLKIAIRVRSAMAAPPLQEQGRRPAPSQAWIRIQANKEEVIKKLLEREWITSRPISEAIEQRAEERPRRWYQPMSKGGSGKNASGFHCEGSAMTRQEWAMTAKRLEALNKQGEWKEFYQEINRITKVKQGSCLVKAIQKGDWTSTNDEERDEAIARFMSELYRGQQTTYQNACQQKKVIFGANDVEAAIRATNFSKAFGQDMFDGTALINNEDFRNRVSREITQMLNEVNFPEYFGEGRLTALSKKEGKSTVQVEDIRPIVIRSHLTKITEKAVLTRLMDKHQHLIRTALSQTGFKRGQSTASNITKMLVTVHPGKGRKKKTAVLLIDLRKAYDSVNREKLFKILLDRCKTEEDKQMVDIIAGLHGKARILIGGKAVETMRGLAQGSVLAPILFNVYLEEALKGTTLCAAKYRSGDLLCYADDIMCVVSSPEEAGRVIRELAEHLSKWDLSMNPDKREILGFPGHEAVEGIKCKQKVKYLGANITLGSDNQRKPAASQVHKNMKYFKAKIWGCNVALKETLIEAYARSLLLYLGLPMNAAGVWSIDQIDRVEAGIYREIHRVPRDVSNAILMNVTQGATPISQYIQKKAAALRKNAQRQETIKWKGATTTENNEEERGKRLYLPREVAATMLALTRGWTIIFFGQRHFCANHQKLVDDEHMRKCEHFEGLTAVHQWAHKLRTSNIRKWEWGDQAAAVTDFALLKIKLMELEATGAITVKDSLANAPINMTSEPKEPDGQQSQEEQKCDVMMKEEQTPPKRPRGRPKKVHREDERQLQCSSQRIRKMIKMIREGRRTKETPEKRISKGFEPGMIETNE